MGVLSGWKRAKGSMLCRLEVDTSRGIQMKLVRMSDGKQLELFSEVCLQVEVGGRNREI